MTLLDRYVGRIVAGAFGASLLFFVFLSILIDMLNSLPKYMDHAAQDGTTGWSLAVELLAYYASLVPATLVTVTPFVTVIACMFAFARLQNANEVVAMLFTGRSIHRVLAPMLLCGVVAGLGMAACWQWVVPIVAPTLTNAEQRIRGQSVLQENLVYEVRGEVDKRLSVQTYDPVTRTMRGVAMLVEATLALETTLTEAAAAVWDPQQKDWRLEQGRLVTQRGYVPQVWLQRGDVTPQVLSQQATNQIDLDLLSYTSLLELAELRSTRADVRLAFHRHLTLPLANVLLLLLALPFAVRYERGSRTGRLLLAIGLCAGYTVVDITCQNLGQHGLHPVVAAWSPPIVFGALGVVLFGSTRS